MQSLALDVTVLDANGEEIDMKQSFDEDDDIVLNVPEPEDENPDAVTVADNLDGFGLEDEEGNYIEDDEMYADASNYTDEEDMM